MRNKYLAIAVLSALALTGCERFNYGTSSGPQLVDINKPAASEASVTSAAMDATNLTTFIDPAAAAKLSAKEKAEAASAQYYALQFGRPGAPRSWQGDTGASGTVSVGPYVRVNSLDCREFTHAITISGQSYTKQGTACRESDGTWDVVDT